MLLPTWIGTAGLSRPACAAAPALTVEGRVRRSGGPRSVDFSLDDLARLPQQSIRTRTPWHAGEPTFSGVLLRAVLEAAGADGETLRLSALNNYRVDIPAEEARRFDIVLSQRIDGRALGVRDKGPLFLMYPFDRHPELRNSVYFSRCIWQLRRIECR